MRVVVLGANGRVGSLLVTELLQRGHTVRAAVHSASRLASHPNLETVAADVYDPASIAAALADADAVLSALGSWGTARQDVLTAGMTAVVSGMQHHNLRRIVSLTGADAEAAGDQSSFVHSASMQLFGLIAPRVLRDGTNHIRILGQSRLDWTVVRSPVMTAIGSPRHYHLSNKRPWPWQTIHRRSVALAMVEVLEQSSWIGRAPYITRGA